MLKKLNIGEYQAVGALELGSESRTEGYAWPPNLLDGALQAGLGVISARTRAALPFAVQSVQQWAPLPRTAWAVVRVARDTGAAVRQLDIAIVDLEGRVALQFIGFSTRSVQGIGCDEGSIEAKTQPDVHEVTSAPALFGELTLAPVWEVTGERTEAWPGSAGRVTCLRGNRERSASGLRWVGSEQAVAFEIEDSRETLIERLAAQPPLEHLVWEVPAGERLVAVMGLRLIQALLALGYGARSFGLSVLTLQGQAVWPQENPDAEQASVHGLIGSLAKEYPHWRVRVFDLPQCEPMPAAWPEVPPAAQGDVRAYREGRWYRQRLVACQLPEAPKGAGREGGVYVVLGGAGGIGVALSEYLVSRYRAQLVWLGRRVEQEESREQCERLAALGPRPLYLQTDATDRQALELAYDTIRKRFGTIHGVVHSAVVLADRSLAGMDELSFEAALSAKRSTAINLAAVFGSEALDFLSFFSSTQSFLKAPGQSNYAAGCCFADAYAHGLRNRGYPVKVMHWGYWGNVGVVATETYRERMSQMGFGSIEPAEAMGALERLLGGPLDEVAFLKTTGGSVAQLLGVSGQTRIEVALEAPMVDLAKPARVPPPQEAGQELEGWLARLLWAQLAALGWLDAETAAPLSYVRWREAALRLLTERGIRLDEQAPVWERERAEWEIYRKSLDDKAALNAPVRLVDATLQALPAILRGERAATEVMFPEGDLGLVEAIYRDHPVADYFNTVLAERLEAYVQARLKRDQQAKLRILEIGAGTGGTSRKLFERLAPYAQQIEQYCYTDLSAVFLLHVQEQYRAQAPYLQAQRLDIERSPEMQGFGIGSYDVVVAANVLHATRDIRQTLRQTKTLLKKNGLLLLNELNGTSLFAHLTFGLLEGWWLAKDRALRSGESPGLAPEVWHQVLRAEGFKSIEAPAEAGHRLGQQIVVATSDGVMQVERETVAPTAAVPPVSPAPAAVTPQDGTLQQLTERYLAGLLAGSLTVPAERIDVQAPLEKYGIDSLMVVTMTRVLEGSFGPLPATLFFEHQNLAALTRYFLQHHADALLRLLGRENRAQASGTELTSEAIASRASGRGRKRRALPVSEPALTRTTGPLDIAVVGLSGRYPRAKTVAEYWANLSQGADCITEIPPERWDWRDQFDPQKGREGKSYSKWGGFLEGVDWFDPMFFNISPREAQLMDPQERLFLQCAYSAIEDAGYTRANLCGSSGSNGNGRPVGVFVGAMYEEYQLYGALAQGQGTGVALAGNASTIANRVSYFGDFQGPSLAVDTMCSSSLTAVHLACQSLRQGGCRVAIAGGVNVTIHPNKYLVLSQGQFVSSQGHCTSFGEGGDGIVPAEGVGAVVLKTLQEAIADGDHIYGVIKGSAVNHGGKTNGYTVPNPKAQAQVIRRALEESGVHPRVISYVEAHGTGTALGDPIEIAGLSEAFGAQTQDKQYCAIGSAKSNVGHCESAAGIAGLTKVLLQMQHGKLVRSLHSERLNPHIDFSRTPFVVQHEFGEWPRPVLALDGRERQYPRTAGISSFGAGGSNAHLIVEEYVAPVREASVVRGPVAIVLSARNEERLQAQVDQLAAHLDEQEVNLTDLAYTLQVGREAFEVRLALVVSTEDDLRRKLADVRQNKSTPEGVYRGEVKRSQETLAVFRADEDLRRVVETWIIANGKVDKLAELWVQGLAVDWGQLYGETKPQRLSLPTYPFAQERYWVPESTRNAATPAPQMVQLHPLLDRNSSELGDQRYSTSLSGEEFFLRDHVVQGWRIVPGAAQLEWARAAVSLALGGELSIGLEQVSWLRPLAVESALEVHIGLSEEAHGRIGYEIYSGQGDETMVYSQGYGVAQPCSEAPQMDLAALVGQCARSLSAAEIYARFSALGIDYGPSFQVLKELRIGQDLAVGVLELGPECRAEGYSWLPSLLDGAFQASVGVITAETGPALPFAVQTVEQWVPAPDSAWVVVRADKGDSAAVRKLDLAITDETGRVALRLRGFSTRPLEDAGICKASQTILAAPQWREQAIPSPAQKETVYGAHWVLLCELEPGSTFETEVAPASCVRLTASGTLEERYLSYAEQLLTQLKAIVQSAPKTAVLLQLVVPGAEVMFQGLGGLLRSAQQEYPMLAGQVVEVESVSELASRLRAEAVAPAPVVRYGPAGREVLSFIECEGPALSEAEGPALSDAPLPWREGGVYWITGGLGGLGRLFAQAIAQQLKGPVLVLTGRSRLALDQEAFLEKLRKLGARVDYRSVDVGQRAAMRDLVQKIVAQYGRLNGVIHAAGVLNDRLLANKGTEEFEQVFRPKVAGLVALDEATEDIALDWMVLCSSVAGIWGNVGQLDYAAANGFMDRYAQSRQGLVTRGLRRGRTVSVSWPLWAEGGMRMDGAAQAWTRSVSGLEALPTKEGLAALSRALLQPASHVVVLYGQRTRLLAHLRTASQSSVVAQSSPGSMTAMSNSAPDGALVAEIERTLRDLIATHMKIPQEAVDRDTPLNEFGFDSVTLTSFGQTLNQRFGLELSPTVFFEAPTIEALAEYFFRKYGTVMADRFGATVQRGLALRPVTGPAELARARRKGRQRFHTNGSEPMAAPLATEPIAVVGMSGCFPEAPDIATFWSNLQAGRDCIGELPSNRWGMSRAPAIRYAGIVEGIDCFDPLFFGISPREAQAMDPQQRLLMQYVYRVIEDAGYSVESLSGSSTALLVGTGMSGYGQLLAQSGEPVAGYSAPGLVGSMGPNRMSYWLNWHGPSEPVETACSSSLVAIHRAIGLLRSGQCEQAVVGGVNTLMSMETHESFIQAGMLSPQGRCRTFSAKADGYVRGEGVGMLFLKPLRAAERDGDHIYGLILGSAENHGGRANSLTAPNPVAQAQLIETAFRQAGVDPRTVSYIEAHGTGTSLGDPVEVEGLKQAFHALAGGKALPTESCGLGTVKSNIGHLELAAGVAGVIKVLLQLQHRQLVASLHSEPRNPHIDLSDSPFYVVKESRPWETAVDAEGRELPRRAGVSSFGFGGVNAHVVLEEYLAPVREPGVVTGPVAVVLSARSRERLQVQVDQLLAYLEQREVNLAELAYTLQAGREALEVRLALVVSAVEELKRKLMDVREQKASVEGVYRGEVKRTQETLAVFRADDDLQRAVEAWIAKGKVGKLAELWVQGLVLDWGALYGETRPPRLSLPGYPFAQERYWAPKSAGNAGTPQVAQLHPLVHRNSSELDEQRYSTTLSGEEFFVRDHVVQGRRIVPGVAQLEWARAALSLALGGENSIRLEQVKWLRPLVVESEQEVHIGLMEEADGRISYEIYSGQSDEAVVYSQGYGVVQRPGEPPQIDLTALLGQCARKLSSAEIYGNFESFGMNYGPSFQVLTELHIGQGLAMGDLELGPDPRPEGYTWLPSLLDGALQASIGVISAQTEPALPFAVQAVEQWAEVPSSAWAVVRAGKGDSAAVRKLDIAITDEEGRVAVQLSGFSTRPFEDIGTGAGSQTILAAPQWRQQAIPGPAQKELVYGAQWVLLCEVDPASTFELEVAPATCVRLKANGALEERYGSYAEQLLRQLKAIVESAPKTPVLLQLVVPGTDAMLQGLGALLRSAQQEYPMLIAQVVAVESVSDLALRLQAEALSPGPVVRYRPAGREVLTFTECESFSLSDAGSFSPSDATLPWRDAGVYWITGGTGGLGRLFAQAIAHQVKGPALVLSGRRALTPREEAFLEELRNQGAQVDYCAVNVGDGAAMRSLAQNIVAKFGRLNGVIHSAGVLGDRLFVNKSSEEFEQVLRPKVAGLVALDEATRDAALDWLVLCSSIAGIWGNVGQTDYAAANSFMDGYAQYRQGLVAQGLRQGRTVSVSWPLWAEGGMQIDEGARSRLRRTTGLEALPSEAGLAALSHALLQPASHVIVLHGKRRRLLTFLQSAWEAPAVQEASPRSITAAPDSAPDDGLAAQVEHALRDLIATHLDIPQEALDRDVPLNEFGFDSITLASFSQALNQRYGLELSPTVFFEATTIEALASYLLREHRTMLNGAFGAKAQRGPAVDFIAELAEPMREPRRRRRALPARPSAPTTSQLATEPIAIVGISGRFPGANDLHTFWENLIHGHDCIEEIPAERWSLDGFYTEDRKAAIAQGLSYCKWGGFIRGTDPTDQDFFNSSASERARLDRTQQLFLETVWNTLESAGYTRAALKQICQSRVGVYVGASLALHENSELNNHDEIPETSAALSSMVSRFFGFVGPSIAIDTRSASSMTAIHMACVALAHEECDVAIAGGVSLLSAAMYRSAYRLNLTGSHIDSRSFAEGRDGMLLGDGAGAVLLKSLSSALRDSDNVLAIVRSTISSYVDSSSNTDALALSSAPNPDAIAQTIKKNILKSGVNPRTISYVESATPGLPIGDALELSAMSKAFREFTEDQQFCALGSVTSNIGHAAAASGMSKLAKVILQMQHEQLAPHIKAMPVSPDLGLEFSPFYLQQEAHEWRRPRVAVDGVEQEFPRRAMVNSLGYGGFYAGAIIEEYNSANGVPDSLDPGDCSGETQLVVLSAKTGERLKAAIRQLRSYVESRQQTRLRDVAYTLQVGREPMPYRWAAIVDSRKDLLHALDSCSDKEFPDLSTGSENLFAGFVNPVAAVLDGLLDPDAVEQILRRYVTEKNLAKLAAWWVKGADIPWDDLQREGSSRRIWLPTYPFGANGCQ